MSYKDSAFFSNGDSPLILVQNLGKMYQLYDRPEDRLKQFIYPRLQSLLGRSVRRYFREFWALRNVSFQVYKGETVGIIGRNGSGKSTLLQVIAGTLAPTQGQVHISGRVSALLELGAGFNPEFSGRENIYTNAAILGMSREEIDERIGDIIEFADIGDFIDQPVKTYSSGMFVRVAFSTAINVNPDILIVDEALSVGDIAFQQKCLLRIREMQEQGVTILLVTHSNNIIMEYCDRGIVLKSGQVIFDGPSKDAVRAYGLDVLENEGGKALVLSSSLSKMSALEINSDDNFWGDTNGLPMEVRNVRFVNTRGEITSTFDYNELLTIEVFLRVRIYIPLPCFGIQLSIPDGIPLWSTTTKFMGLELPSLNPGFYKVRWQIRANFAGNRYVVAIGVGYIENGEYKRYQSLPYAGYIDILPVPNQGAGWLVVDPIFNIDLYEIDNVKSTQCANLYRKSDSLT